MIIINGGSRTNGRFFAAHLMRGDMNDRVEVREIRGVCSDNIRDALREMEAVASGTRIENYFYHANINPDTRERNLTPEEWREAVDTLERNLGLIGQPRFVVEHEKEGRTHQHIIWSRVDLETMRAKPDSLNYAAHERTSRELEIAFGLERGESVLTPDRDGQRPERTPESWAMMKAEKTGIDPRDVKAEVTALWQQTDSGKAFQAAVEERGYVLARGDRRDFVLIDSAGTDHSLARRLDGVKAAEVRERMANVDRAALPSVAEAKAMQRQQQAEMEGRGGSGDMPPAPEKGRSTDAIAGARRAEKAVHSMEKAATKSFGATVAGGEKLIDLVGGAADFFFATPRTVTPQEAAASSAAMVEYMQASAFERRREMAYDRMMEERAAGKHLTRDDVRYLSEADRANYRAHGDTALDQVFRDREIEEERKRARHREL